MIGYRRPMQGRSAGIAALRARRRPPVNFLQITGGTGGPPQRPPACGGASAAVEDVVAEVLHFEDGGVGAAGDRVRQVRLGDLADDDVVVALLDDARHLAFDRGERGVEDRCAVAALVEGLAGELAAFERGRLEEGEGEALVLLAQHVEGEGLGVLDDRIGAAVGLDADDDQRRVERRLRHPVDRRRGDPALAVVGGQHVDAVGDHPQRSFLGVLVHRLPPLAGPGMTA